MEAETTVPSFPPGFLRGACASAFRTEGAADTGNVEWIEGAGKRFGPVRIDDGTPRRRPRRSTGAARRGRDGPRRAATPPGTADGAHPRTHTRWMRSWLMR
ncbi:hypothetical protein GCM10015535_27320 [Streptomyces gelaticus]|uniref:Uncharacterized protein n=1 Tax=Streptomyces gelaticus TaxID=285446 RepID=A0ABQ2W0J4_9ACTN|nr:hypothetical protein GCM10015535_27320 [Streptomyces gelaticus]